MLLSAKAPKPYSSFSEWGRGWADPEIRRQRLESRRGETKKRRLERRRGETKKRKMPARKQRQDVSTVRGRLAAKLSKCKKVTL